MEKINVYLCSTFKEGSLSVFHFLSEAEAKKHISDNDIDYFLIKSIETFINSNIYIEAFKHKIENDILNLLINEESIINFSNINILYSSTTNMLFIKYCSFSKEVKNTIINKLKNLYPFLVSITFS